MSAQRTTKFLMAIWVANARFAHLPEPNFPAHRHHLILGELRLQRQIRFKNKELRSDSERSATSVLPVLEFGDLLSLK